jgi:transcriptional regulator with XRE-family HTH domain
VSWRDLRDLRRNRGLRLDDVAEKTGISKSYLSLLERGLREPTPVIAKKLGDFYGFKVTDVWPVDSPTPATSATGKAAA